MYTDKFSRILALFVAGTLLSGIAGCKTDEDFREERKEKAARDFQQARTKEFLSGEILSLEDCINFAVSHNLQLKTATLEKEAFESMRLAEGLGILPKVDLSGRIGGKHAVPGALNSSVSGFTGSLEYEFNYSLLDACMAIFQTRQAHDRLILREKRAERLKQNITLEVSKLYYRVAALQKHIKEVRKLREEIKKYKKEAARPFQLEMITLAQLNAFSSVEEALAGYEEKYESAKSRLRSLLGMYPNGDIKVNETLLARIPSLPPKVLLHELEQVALMQRPELYVRDIRSNLNRTQCYKAFFQLWPALRVYREVQVGSAADSWENIAWTACNLLKTPEILLQCKGNLQKAELEELQGTLQGLAVMAQVRLADANFKSSSKIYSTFQQESDLLAAALKGKKKGKSSVAQLNVPALRKKLESAMAGREAARKKAQRIKDDNVRTNALKKVETDWKKVLSANNRAVRSLQWNLTTAQKAELLQSSALLAAIRKDLALAQLHTSYGKIFNAMGFTVASNTTLEGSIALVKAAEKGSAREGIEQIRQEIARSNAALAEKKKTRSLYEEGAKAYVGKEHIKSVEYLKRAAERGNAEAFFGLGKLYWNGQGVARDYRMALKCYARSADLGKLEAMLLAGWLYYNGGIIEKDLELARKYYKMAADRNDERAFYWLGMIHFELKRYKQALDYFKYAARGGDVAAMTWAGTLYRNGLPEGKANLNKAIFWYTRAAEKGDLNAMNSLHMIYKGAFEGEKENKELAEEWRLKYEAALKRK